MPQKGPAKKHSANLPGLKNSTLLFFLVWPFAAFVYALKHFRIPEAKTIFWLFCVFFGFVFIYEDPALGRFGADSASYAADLIQIHNNPLSFNELISTFYNKTEGVVDIYQPLLTWLVSIFTGDPRYLFALFAAVFGFFYAQNLWLVFQRIEKPVGLALFTLLLALALINPIWNINGVRMWTAGQVFVFGVLQYFLNEDKKGLIWSALSVLFHFAYLFPLAILLTWIFLPKKTTPFFVFYFIAAFIDEINLAELRNALSFLPDIFQPRIEGYTNEAYAENVAEASGRLNWHVQLSGLINRWLTYVWVIFLYAKNKHWAKEFPVFQKFFIFSLFLGGFAHLAGLVPSGGRFITIANTLFFSLFVLLLGQKSLNLRMKKLTSVSIPLFLYLSIFKFRMGFDFMGILLFLGNPFIALFWDSQTPLIEFVKSIF